MTLKSSEKSPENLVDTKNNGGYRELGRLIEDIRAETGLSNSRFVETLNEINADIIAIYPAAKSSSNIATVGHENYLDRIPHLDTLLALERFTNMPVEDMVSLILRDVREAIALHGKGKVTKRKKTVKQEDVLAMVEGMSDGMLFLLMQKIFDCIGDRSFRKRFVLQIIESSWQD